MLYFKKKGATELIRKISFSQILINMFFAFFAICCIMPFVIAVSTSLSSELDIVENGYSLFPKNFDSTAYRYVFLDFHQMFRSFLVSVFVTVVGTALSVLIMAMIAYPLSRSDYQYRNIIAVIVFFTMLFSGGLVPYYILVSRYLRLTNNIFVLILPTLVNGFHVIMLRTFFQTIPTGVIESCKLDGASEYRIFWQFILPLSKPALATVAFLGALARWNDWFTPMLFISKNELLPLQYMLHRIMTDLMFLTQNTSAAAAAQIGNMGGIPSETIRMAMMVVAAGPMLFVFPLFQKYLVKGMTVGAIKG